MGPASPSPRSPDGPPDGLTGEPPDGPPDGLTEALADLLDLTDGGPLPHEVADVLWIAELAGLLAPPPPVEQPRSAEPPTTRDRPTPAPQAGPPRRPSPRPAVRPPAPRPADGAAPAPPSPPPTTRRPGPNPAAPPPAGRPSAAPRAALHPRPGPAGPDGRDRPGGHAVQVAQPAALTGGLALARALRPLRRPVDAPGRATLDEDATAEATAETGILLPAWRPAQRPRFSVDLLVDTGATMAVWHRLAGELSTLLERHGAFADVRCWALDTDGPVPALAPFHRRRPGARAVTRSGWSVPLKDPTGRRILLVLTDGVGPAWYGDELPDFLAAVTTERPTAALQVLPRRLWHRTALRTAAVEARVSVAGRPLPAFRSDAALPGVPRGARGADLREGVRWLPVLEVDADWVTPWADLTAGRTSGWTPMLAAPIGGLPEDLPRPRRPTGPAGDPATPAERVDRFRAGSSPTAYRLACHLAAAPLSLPVMRLVQRATVPESGQTDLAELFVSGLIEPRGGAAADPDEQVYDFRDGVRDELLAELTRTESVHVLEHVLARVSGRVAATFGGTLDFRAVARVGAADGGTVRLSAQSLPFAEVALAVLAGAGGQHAGLVARLADAVARTAGGTPVPPPPVRRELLNPVRPVLSPPEPVRMIGRRRELAALAAAFAPDRVSAAPERPALAVVVGETGTGRRRLIQEYARAYGDRHAFVHWIDARRPDSLEEGLGKLRAALAGSGESLDSSAALWARLARHRDWLLVLDGVPRNAWNGDPRFPLPFPPHGRGCLLVTTDTVGSWADPAATVITLGALRTDEVLDELRARLSPAYDPDDEDLEAALRRLAERLPRRPDLLALVDLEVSLFIALDRDRSTTARPPGSTESPSPSPSPDLAVEGSQVVPGPPHRIPAPLSGLPLPSLTFTGSEERLAALLTFLAPAPPGRTGGRTALVTGLPGVGKSELVLQAAATAVDRGWFPTGVLHLDLATDIGTPAQALGALLRDLGVPAELVPADPRDRAALYWAALGGLTERSGPVLLVLDNAPAGADLGPLLPAHVPVVAMVSSRYSLPIDATPYQLGTLTREESVRFLQEHLEAARHLDRRVPDAPQQALALAELCGGLPLALAICAARLAEHPHRSLASMVQELSDPTFRLAGLSHGERSLRVAFTDSYVQLTSNEARLLRLLSVYPHPEVSTHVAAGLAGLADPVAEQLMAELARAGLVEATPPAGHWYFHPLIRLYAVSRGEAIADVDDRAGALTRLLKRYRSMTESAVDPRGGPGVRFRDPERARAWLEAEQSIMVALIAHAAQHGDPTATVLLAGSLAQPLIRDRQYTALTTVAEGVRTVDRRRGNREGAEWLLRAVVEALDHDPRIKADQGPALDRVFRVLSGAPPEDDLRLAVQVANSSETGALRQLLADLLHGSPVEGRLLDAPLGFGAELLLTVPAAADPLATAGAVILDLWDRIKRLGPTARPRTQVGVAVLLGPVPVRLPGAVRLRERLVEQPQRAPVAAVVVSRAVFDLLTERFGGDMTTSFDLLLPAGARPPREDEAYLYRGDPQLLGLILSQPSAGRIIES